MEKIARIVITPGEPAGIGPDLVIKLAQENVAAELVAIADPALLNERAQKIGLPLSLIPYAPDQSAAPHIPGTLKILPITTAQPVHCGQLSQANVPYVLQSIDIATDKTLAGEFAALVTGPVHKGIINAAGIPFSGHTEYLQQRTKAAQVVMLMQVDSLRVALATTHLPLKAVPSAITQPALRATLVVLNRALIELFGIARPRILVAGLNPHAGENGYLGDEEQTIITPVILQLRDEGMDIQGPLPADTLFTPQYGQAPDCFLAMYHDQGLPIIKHLGFDRAVNITLGLPIIRTSVDHGTALPLAGGGAADPGSLRAAVQMAIALSAQKQQPKVRETPNLSMP